MAGLALIAAAPLLLTACGADAASRASIMTDPHAVAVTGSSTPSGDHSVADAGPTSTPSHSTTAGRSTHSATPSAAATTSTGVATPVGAADCAAKTPSGWGKPVRQDSFSTSTSTPSGWGRYDDTTSSSLRDPAQVKVSGGNLKLIGTTENGKSVGAGVSDEFKQKYGRWEVCLRADKGAGYYPVITLWPANNNWPTDGEIDLLESVDGNRQTNIFYVHNNANNQKTGKKFILDLTKWHELAVDWTPTSVVFWVDGVQTWVMNTQRLVPTTASMHLTLQNDARNSPNCRDGCRDASTPAHPTMYVDWIKAYKYQG